MTSEVSDEPMHMHSLIAAIFANLHPVWGTCDPAKIQTSLRIRAISPELSLLSYKQQEEYVTKECSDESVHMYRLT